MLFKQAFKLQFSQHSTAELYRECLYVFNQQEKRANIVYLLAVNQERRSLE